MLQARRVELGMKSQAALSDAASVDMPTDATPTKVELHDSMFSGGVTVSLK